MRRAIVITVLICLSVLSCKKKKPLYHEVKDGDLTIQAMQLEKQNDDINSISYKVRLIPNKSALQNISGDKKMGLMYRMDSCFYINQNNQKLYAALTQPVANGVSGTYEYLVEFEVDKAGKSDSLQLMYQDKYVNKKVYNITSNQK